MWKTIESGKAASSAPVVGINVAPKCPYCGGLYDAFASEFIAGGEIDCSPRTQLDRTDALAEGSESLQSFLNTSHSRR